MNCIEINKDMIDFLEDKLPEEKSSEFKSHLKECRQCSEFSSFLEHSLKQIEIEKQVKDDHKFIIEVFDRIDSKPNLTTRVRSIVPILAAASVIVFAVFTGINIARYSSGTFIPESNSSNNDILFANELSREPIENFFLINEDEKD
jgi:hypothetical protein